MKYDNKEDILQLTPHWKGDRYDNGRPRVPDDILKRMQHVALEEAWACCGATAISTSFRTSGR